MAADKRQPAGTEVAAPEVKAPAQEFDDLRDHVPADIRNISFQVSVRGYDRDAVEAYVRRVNQVIAELEVSRSPEAAVRHALDRVGQQTIAVLQEARESADKLMAAAREEADEGMARAKAEAATLVVNSSAEADRTKAEAEHFLAAARDEADRILVQARAEAAELRKKADAEIATLRAQAEERMREIQSDTDDVWKQRDRLLGETHAMANRLQALAAGAAARLSPEATTEPTGPPATEAEPTPDAAPAAATAKSR